jgi:hypothetical protein
MKNRFLLPSIAVALFSGFASYLILSDSDVFAQGASSAASAINQTASVTKFEDRSSGFAKAAQENRKLRNSLAWTFGGKTQSGWNIYVPLISQTIGTDVGPDTSEFALALSKWQVKYGLAATGVLDGETLASFTKYWQSQRLGRAGLAATDSLMAAPISEFFDGTRSPDLLQLERDTYAFAAN